MEQRNGWLLTDIPPPRYLLEVPIGRSTLAGPSGEGPKCRRSRVGRHGASRFTEHEIDQFECLDRRKFVREGLQKFWY